MPGKQPERRLSGVDRLRGMLLASLFHQLLVESPHRERHQHVKSWGCAGEAPVVGPRPLPSTHSQHSVFRLPPGTQTAFASTNGASFYNAFKLRAVTILARQTGHDKPPGSLEPAIDPAEIC
jgi:hypothetical protein